MEELMTILELKQLFKRYNNNILYNKVIIFQNIYNFKNNQKINIIFDSNVKIICKNKLLYLL